MKREQCLGNAAQRLDASGSVISKRLADFIASVFLPSSGTGEVPTKSGMGVSFEPRQKTPFWSKNLFASSEFGTRITLLTNIDAIALSGFVPAIDINRHGEYTVLSNICKESQEAAGTIAWLC